jgi:hypothetical protein
VHPSRSDRPVDVCAHAQDYKLRRWCRGEDRKRLQASPEGGPPCPAGRLGRRSDGRLAVRERRGQARSGAPRRSLRPCAAAAPGQVLRQRDGSRTLQDAAAMRRRMPLGRHRRQLAAMAPRQGAGWLRPAAQNVAWLLRPGIRVQLAMRASSAALDSCIGPGGRAAGDEAAVAWRMRSCVRSRRLRGAGARPACVLYRCCADDLARVRVRAGTGGWQLRPASGCCTLWQARRRGSWSSAAQGRCEALGRTEAPRGRSRGAPWLALAGACGALRRAGRSATRGVPTPTHARRSGASLLPCCRPPHHPPHRSAIRHAAVGSAAQVPRLRSRFHASGPDAAHSRLQHSSSSARPPVRRRGRQIAPWARPPVLAPTPAHVAGHQSRHMRGARPVRRVRCRESSLCLTLRRLARSDVGPQPLRPAPSRARPHPPRRPPRAPAPARPSRGLSSAHAAAAAHRACGTCSPCVGMLAVQQARASSRSSSATRPAPCAAASMLATLLDAQHCHAVHEASTHRPHRAAAA